MRLVIVPFQTLIADRYLVLSVMAPSLLVGAAATLAPRYLLPAAGVLTAALAAATAQRASLFSDSVRLFSEATNETTRNPAAPYQLGQALEAAGDDEAAIAAYRSVLTRAPGREETARRATNNLAKLLARRGNSEAAERVLRRGRALWPDDPQVMGNHAEVLARLGRAEPARRLFEELVRRFPDYEWGVRKYRERYGRRQ